MDLAVERVLARRARGLDVHRLADRERLVSAALDRFGRVDVLVNNASTLGPVPLPLLADIDPDAFEEVVRVDLVAPFRLARAVVGAMLMHGFGVLINVSSDAAVEAYPGWGAYAAAKAGLDGLTRVWAAELAGSDGKSELLTAAIRVAPGEAVTWVVDYELGQPLDALRVLPSARWPGIRWTAGGDRWNDARRPRNTVELPT